MNNNNHAPWTQEQVDSLNAVQKCGYMHPYTCCDEDCRADMIATKEGWFCPECKCVRQTWYMKGTIKVWKLGDPMKRFKQKQNKE